MERQKSTSSQKDDYSDLILTSHALDALSMMRQPWDTIVIGSGMGGLSAAAALAKGANERILLLERHNQLGGNTHELRKMGIDFDTGVHYVGSQIWKPGSFARKLSDWLTDGKLIWEPLDDVYDVAIIDGERYNIRTGIHKQKIDLKQKFPSEADKIEAYWNEIESEGAKFTKWMRYQLATAYVPSLFMSKDLPFGQETVSQALDRVGISNQQLRRILTYVHGNYGARPEEASWSQHCITVYHYCNGAAYPVGGSGKIARSVLSVIEAHGGRAHTKAEVESIYVEGVVCKGVVMKGGTIIRANKVISAVGAAKTYTRLLPPDLDSNFPFLAQARQDLLAESPPNKPTHFMTFLAFKSDTKSLNLPRSNYWILDESEFPTLFVSFPSAKDPSWEDRYDPHRSTCEIVTELPVDMFAKWKNDDSRDQSANYIKLREDMADKLCGILFKHFPQLQDEVEFRETSTPLDAEHFLETSNSYALGLVRSPTKYKTTWLKPATDIKNLYLGAQDLFCYGLVGSQIGGLVTACASSFRVLLQFAKNLPGGRLVTETSSSSNELETIQDEVDVGGVAF